MATLMVNFCEKKNFSKSHRGDKAGSYRHVYDINLYINNGFHSVYTSALVKVSVDFYLVKWKSPIIAVLTSFYRNVS